MQKILKYNGKNHSLVELRNGLKKLTEIENLVLDARLSNSPSFSELDAIKLRQATDKIILHGSSLVGCELPLTEIFAETLSNAILSFFEKFGYFELNLNEVLLAMEMSLKNRLRLPSGIDLDEIVFTGRCVNVSYLARVLYNYTVIRMVLDRKFQNLIDGIE